MTATKEQEFKALERIKKIIEELGENSYIGMAFEGCFEVAEANIENDWGCSMKQRAEAAEEKAKRFMENASKLAADSSELEKENKELRTRVLLKEDIGYFVDLMNEKLVDLRNVEDKSANEIVEFADNPNLDEFKRAVSRHRNAGTSIENLQARIKKITIMYNA